MEADGGRRAQGEPAVAAVEPSSANWRADFNLESRHRVVDKILETLRMHLPVTTPEALTDLQNAAITFEEKMYTTAINQTDYVRKIATRMVLFGKRMQNSAPINPSLSITAEPGEFEGDPSDAVGAIIE